MAFHFPLFSRTTDDVIWLDDVAPGLILEVNLHNKIISSQ